MKQDSWKKSFPLVVLFIAAFEAVVLVVLVFFPYLPSMPLVPIEEEAFSLLAPLSPVLLIGLLYGWTAKQLFKKLEQHSNRFKEGTSCLARPLVGFLSRIESVDLTQSAQGFSFLNRAWMVLAIAAASAFFLAFIPYRPDLNPTGSLVGIDAPLYLSWTNQMLQRPGWGAFQYAFVGGLQGSRPAFLILLFSVSALGVPSYQLVQGLPWAMGPALVLSSYFFARSGEQTQGFAGLIAVVTAFSFYITVGMWAAYYANWFALIEAYLFLAFLFRLSKTPSISRFAVTALLSLALLLTHPWTWVMVLSVSAVFAVTVWRETHNSLLPKLTISLVATGIALDVAKSMIFGVKSLGSDLATKIPQSLLSQFFAFWPSLVYGQLFTQGGLFSNSILIGLGLLAVLTLKFSNRFDRLLILWVGLSSIPFLVLDGYNQTRILYDLPIPVLASRGLLLLSSTVATRNLHLPKLLSLMMILILADYAVAAMVQL